jgi:enamine deaminase RidA (YjgF/YER057c/UK114 family)
MSLKFINPETVAKPTAAYSNVAIVPPGRRLLVLAGQVGNRLDGSFVEGLEGQFEQALANVNAIVASEGGTAADVARVTCFLVEKPTDGARIGAAIRGAFPDGLPAMSWIYVAGLFRPDLKVEIEAIAAVL